MPIPNGMDSIGRDAGDGDRADRGSPLHRNRPGRLAIGGPL